MFFIFWQPLPAILLSRFQNQLRIKSLFIHAFFLKTVLFYGILLWRSFQSRIEVKYQLPSYTCSSIYDNENFFSCRTYCCTFDNFHTISNVNADAESRSRNRKIDFLQRQYEAVTDRSGHLSGYSHSAGPIPWLQPDWCRTPKSLHYVVLHGSGSEIPIKTYLVCEESLETPTLCI